MKLSRAEFDSLALQHLDLLFRVASRLTRNSAAAEDLVQDTFVRAFRARDDFDLKEYGIRPWLVRIMHNLHISRAQRDRRHPITIDEAALDAAEPARSQGSEIITSTMSYASAFEAMDEQVVRAVRDLPEEYQTALLLWAVEDFSYKEIADALDIPIGTVMSRLHRARAKLSEQLAAYAKKEGVKRE